MLSLANTAEGTMLLINKPLGWTSFDIIKKVRNLLRITKIGHAGTLDPLATGLLIVCTGKQTKTISEYQNLDKVYIGQLILGKTTPSIDLETIFDIERPYDHITEKDIYNIVQEFIGPIIQVPPAYSAIKIKGERAYKKIRKGQEVVLKPRQVVIKELKITSINMPEVNFEIMCSKGTYIRSLVRDFAERLGTCAYLSQLCRTHIGPYRLQDAYDIETIVNFTCNNSDIP